MQARQTLVSEMGGASQVVSDHAIWREAKSLRGGASSSLDEYLPVVALTIVDSKLSGPLVTAVRSEGSNLTHPNVLSVPTMRVPAGIARLWLPHLGATSIPDDIGVGSMVSGLMCRKLGLGDSLELRRFTYELVRIQAWQGISVIDSDDPEYGIERLTMFNVIVRVTTGASLLPRETASYELIRWHRQDTFETVAETRDLTPIGPDYDPIRVCVHGLCVRTTLEHLREMR